MFCPPDSESQKHPKATPDLLVLAPNLLVLAVSLLSFFSLNLGSPKRFRLHRAAPCRSRRTGVLVSGPWSGNSKTIQGSSQNHATKISVMTPHGQHTSSHNSQGVRSMDGVPLSHPLTGWDSTPPHSVLHRVGDPRWKEGQRLNDTQAA